MGGQGQGRRNLRRPLALSACLLFALTSCGGDDSSSAASGGGGTGAVSSGGTGGSGGSAGSGGSSGGSGGVAGQSTGGASGGGGTAGAGGFALTSSAYGEGDTIPQKYECTSGGGQSVSPPLAWTPGPTGTQSYAIVMRDLDFQNGFLHWVMWDIPATTLSLPEGVEQVYQPSVPAGAKQAPFNASVIGYYGPCSPSSVNTYQITVYALPVASLSGLDQTSSNSEAEAAIVAGASASAALSGES
jgi:Raf kinase inhibitor-like YbhB/YbcL family protein